MDSRIRRIAVAGLTTVVAAAGAGSAYAALSSSGPAYRLASVTSANVTATLSAVGTLTPLRQADVGFSAAGTVATVAVQPGQPVTAGQTLGTLNEGPLKASLTAAQSALANANLKVTNDIASQDAAASGQAGASSPSGGSGAPAAALRALQQAVIADQRAADAALAKARTDLTLARQVCPGAPGQGSGPGGPARPKPTPSPLPSPSPTPSPAPASCATAEQQVLTDETAVSRAQQALAGQLSALGAALARDASPSPGAGSGGGSPGRSGSPGGAPGSPGGAPGGAVSADQLAADQASADAAADQLAIARQNLAGATAVTPISGTVVSVSAEPGASAAPGSTAFEIAGLDSWQVVAQIPVTDMPQIAADEPASVLPDGSGVPLSGTVVSVGLMPTSGSNPATYPVTIGLAGQPSGLHDGGDAGVTITTAHSSGVSVPTSAVHYSGSHATVTVYAAGKTRTTKVTVGTKGPVMTRITSGLSQGEQVVLANLNAPLPSDNPNNGGQFPGPGVRVNIVGPGVR